MIIPDVDWSNSPQNVGNAASGSPPGYDATTGIPKDLPADYEVARGALTANYFNGLLSTYGAVVGQQSPIGKVGGITYAQDYYLYETLLYFDTSVLGGNAPSAASLVIAHPDLGYVTTNFDVQARAGSPPSDHPDEGDWSPSGDPLAWVASGDLAGMTLLAHLSTSEMTTGAPATFHEESDGILAANVDPSGTTYVHLSSSRQFNDQAPVTHAGHLYSPGDPDLELLYAYTDDYTFALVIPERFAVGTALA